MKKLILVALLWVVAGQGVAQEGVAQEAVTPGPGELPSLVVELQTDKLRYDVDERIRLTYIVHNVSIESSFWINTESLLYAPSCLRIKGPKGVMTSQQRLTGEVMPAQRPLSALLLPAQGFYGKVLNLRQEYPEPFAFGHAHNFNVPGKYEIVGLYSNQELFDPADKEVDKETEKQKARQLWVGQIESAPLVIEVNPLTPAQLAEMKTALQAGQNKEAQLKALNLMRKVEAREFLEQAAALLDSKADIIVRRTAAAVLFEMPEARFSDTYIKYLTDEEGGIRIDMALGIRPLKEHLSPAQTKQAVAALIKLADFKTYPDTYLSAVGALRIFKAPESKEILQELAQTAPRESERLFAQYVLKEISNQPLAVGKQSPEVGK